MSSYCTASLASVKLDQEHHFKRKGWLWSFSIEAASNLIIQYTYTTDAGEQQVRTWSGQKNLIRRILFAQMKRDDKKGYKAREREGKKRTNPHCKSSKNLCTEKKILVQAKHSSWVPLTNTRGKNGIGIYCQNRSSLLVGEFHTLSSKSFERRRKDTSWNKKTLLTLVRSHFSPKQVRNVEKHYHMQYLFNKTTNFTNRMYRRSSNNNKNAGWKKCKFRQSDMDSDSEINF